MVADAAILGEETEEAAEETNVAAITTEEVEVEEMVEVASEDQNHRMTPTNIAKGTAVEDMIRRNA